MNDSSFLPDNGHDPSAWSKRLPAAVLALLGCAIASYLALYQLGVVGQVWEPFFGNGSRFILKESAISRWLPVPDAALGAAVYLIEAVAECIGGPRRWRTQRTAVFVAGGAATALVLAALVLVVCQLLWFQAYCTLCLASAACSFAIAGIVAPEVWLALKYHREFDRKPESSQRGGI